MLRVITTTSSSWAMFPIRIGLGLIFIAHGLQKVFGAFGGQGFDAWMSTPIPLPVQPVKLWLALAAFGELAGGFMVLLGFATRLGAFLLFCIMTVAILFVHWRYGFFIRDGSVDGIEFAFALWCMALALLIEGGGRGSVDSTW